MDSIDLDVAAIVGIPIGDFDGGGPVTVQAIERPASAGRLRVAVIAAGAVGAVAGITLLLSGYGEKSSVSQARPQQPTERAASLPAAPLAEVLLSNQPSRATADVAARVLGAEADALPAAGRQPRAWKRTSRAFDVAAASPRLRAPERSGGSDDITPPSSQVVAPDVFDGEVFAKEAPPNISLERQERQEAVDAIRLLRQR